MRVVDEIVNPRTGQHMSFDHTDASVLRITTLNPPGPPEPMHLHPTSQTSADVISGVLHFVDDGEEHMVPAGGRIVIPANTPHLFWNPGPEDAHAIQEFRPAARAEEFFRAYFAMDVVPSSRARRVAAFLRLVVLISQYGDVLRPVSPPWPMVRLLGGLLRPFVRLRSDVASLDHCAPTVPGDASNGLEPTTPRQ
jgi:quercetin dioxygenase-like cupin family protein